MMDFKSYIAKEDSQQVMQMMQQQAARMSGRAQQQGSTMGTAVHSAIETGAKAVADTVGLGGLIDVAMWLNTLIKHHSNKTQGTDWQARVQQLQTEMQGLKIPKNLIAFDENVVSSMSLKAFVAILQHVLTHLRSLNGNYNDPELKRLFALKARDYFKEVFGNYSFK